jgi:hypothetical protein
MCCAVVADACYAAPGIYTGWCDTNHWINGDRSLYVQYCFKLYGDATMHCEAKANGYPGRGAYWGDYDLGVINDGDCMRMYWGAVAARPSVRCWAYGTGVMFTATCN